MVVSLCLGLALITAQPPPASPPEPAAAPTPPAAEDLAALAARMDAAHRGAAAPRDVQAFQAGIRLEPRHGDTVTVDLLVDFRLAKSIRYAVKEKGLQVERGFDPRRGPWVRSDAEVTPLQGREHNKEAEQVLKEIRLCRQLLSFLDPATMLGELKSPGPIERADLALTKRLRFPGCTTVTGTLESYPTYALGSDGRARVALFVHPETDRLLAVMAQPLDAEAKPTGDRELLLLEDYRETQDTWLPTKLNVYRVAGGVRQPEVTVHVTGIELAKEFAANHFDRPER